jgi:hypothetical protein
MIRTVLVGFGAITVCLFFVSLLKLIFILLDQDFEERKHGTGRDESGRD